MYDMAKRITWRSIVAVLILAITIAAFSHYFATHPEVRRLLGETSLSLILTLLALYALFIGSLVLINNATLRICGTRLFGRESLLLTMYSSVINFFGPLQSGPAFRALYLKKQHNINLKSYGLATLMYYGFYGFFSGLFLISGILGKWLILFIILSLVIGYFVYHSSIPLVRQIRKLNLTGCYYLAAATFVQIVLQAVIYYIELHSIVPGISISQVVIYTGAANFALFVALTPGAIGFRESFLIFSNDLHLVSNGTIVVANTIDRAVYVSLLLILAIIIFSTHAHKKLTGAIAVKV